MMKNILITGGAGFIGSHLCKKLINNNKIICVDNLISGNLKNIKNLVSFKNFKFIKHDIVKPLKLQIKINQIFNLACPASPVDYQKMPIQTLDTCSLGTKVILELARKNKAKLLHASTSEVYGDPKVHPQKESYWGNANPIGPRSCYDEGKRFAESLIINYRKTYNLDTQIVRIFNTYGPNMRPNDGRVVSNFIIQALQNKPITIYGQGTHTRSFCYISDMIEGIIAMSKSNQSGPINLGNPSEFAIIKLAKIIIYITNSKSKLVFRALPIDDPIKRKPNISLAKKYLEYKPKVKLEEGLKQTIEWFKQELGKNI